ncbi:MAG: dethiobiotin synthase [Smithella sp.]
MPKGIYIVGTDTEVGKTVVSAGLMHLMLAQKYRSSYFKPVASGAIVINGITEAIDAVFVRTASGFSEKPRNITPFVFKNEVAPYLAARLEQMPINVGVIKDRFQYLKGCYEWIIAEGAGGLAVPLNDEGYMQYDLIRELGFSCLLVANAGLGTINHTLLSVHFARSIGLKIKGIIINGSTKSLLERYNAETITKLAGVPAVITIPALTGVDTEKCQTGNLKEVFEKSIVIDQIMAEMDEL